MIASGPPTRVADEPKAARYTRYKKAIANEPLPLAIVDLDALDENVARLCGPVRAAGKTLRLATKSVRSPALVDYLVDRGGGTIGGLMTFTAAETAFLADRGATDLLLAYPTVHGPALAALAGANTNSGTSAAIVVDSFEHLPPLARAAIAAGTTIPVVIEVDLSYRPLGASLHLGVRRSPLRDPDDVVALAKVVAKTDGLRFHGIMAYEAHVAGVTDASPFAPLLNGPKRAMKRAARPHIERTRTACVQRLAAAGLAPRVVNGGGTGSLAWSIGEAALTEVTAGSGFLASHLFDYYEGLALVPAAAFAVEVCRKAAPNIYTCHGGGFVASGEAGRDRLPLPWLPEGLSLLGMEGAGEVQTPLVGADGALALGDPVFFRHAKAGELGERVNEYLLVRGDRVVGRAPTYRGLGHAFL